MKPGCMSAEEWHSMIINININNNIMNSKGALNNRPSNTQGQPVIDELFCREVDTNREYVDKRKGSDE